MRLRGLPKGARFSAANPLRGFIDDFYPPSGRPIVEVDGGYHEQRLTADAHRGRKLVRGGYRVLSVPAELVTRDLPAVLRPILQALRGL